MSMWARARDGARATHMLCARVRTNPVWFELPSSYVSYLIVSAGTDLAGAILAGYCVRFNLIIVCYFKKLIID